MQTVLAERVRKALDGEGVSSPMATLADEVLLGTRLDEAAAAAAIGEAVTAENTDVQIPIPLTGVGDAGTWTKAISATGVRTVTRTAAAASEGYWVETQIRLRTASGKGFKLTGVRASWQTTVAAQTDVQVHVYKRIQAAVGNVAPAAPTLLAGNVDGHYDAGHNTAAERNTVAEHTAEVTLPAPAYLAADEEILIRFFVQGLATAVTALKDLRLLGSETLVDAA
jgi:hypothetical protein